MQNEGRINLWFNLNDNRHKAVYELLMSWGRKKTNFVVDAVLAESKRKATTDSSATTNTDFTEIIEKSLSQVETRLSQVIHEEVEKALSTVNIVEIESIDKTDSENAIATDTYSDDNEMSEDAFAAMSAFFGGA